MNKKKFTELIILVSSESSSSSAEKQQVKRKKSLQRLEEAKRFKKMEGEACLLLIQMTILETWLIRFRPDALPTTQTTQTTGVTSRTKIHQALRKSKIERFWNLILSTFPLIWFSFCKFSNVCLVLAVFLGAILGFLLWKMFFSCFAGGGGLSWGINVFLYQSYFLI